MNVDLKLADVTQGFVDLFETNKAILCNSGNAHADRTRLEAIKSLAKLKIPGRKSEAYKYTSIGDLLNREHNHVFSPKKIEQLKRQAQIL